MTFEFRPTMSSFLLTQRGLLFQGAVPARVLPLPSRKCEKNFGGCCVTFRTRYSQCQSLNSWFMMWSRHLFILSVKTCHCLWLLHDDVKIYIDIDIYILFHALHPHTHTSRPISSKQTILNTKHQSLGAEVHWEAVKHKKVVDDEMVRVKWGQQSLNRPIFGWNNRIAHMLSVNTSDRMVFLESWQGFTAF